MDNINFVDLQTYTKKKLLYEPDKRLDTYYQICQFKNPYTKKHMVRKIVFNENGNIIKNYEREYDSSSLKKFIKTQKTNKYKLYSKKDINYICNTTESDIIL